MRLPAPIRVGPLMTTCGPIQVPAPTCTSGPMTEKGPTWTSGASSARGSTSACGSIIGADRRGVTDIGGEHHLCRCGFLPFHQRRRRQAPDTLERTLKRRGQNQLIARLDRTAKPRLVDADEIKARAVVWLDAGGGKGKDPRRLRQRLNDDHAG